MTADWIKMRTDLYRDPKVCVIADELMSPDGELARYVNQICQRDMAVTRNVTRNVTVGALVTVWGVMRHRGKRDGDDLVCRGVRLAVIDDVADLPGLGAAMAVVGWVDQTDTGVVFPGFFSDYNVDPNEKKATASAERQRRYREKNRRDSDVTRDVTVTHREEKSREEKKEQKKDAPVGATPPAPPKAKSVTLASYLADCQARDVDAIPEDDAVFAWAESVRLPDEYVALAWGWFKGKYGAGGDRATKRYADWRAVFRNAVKDGWPKFWAIGQDGGYYLTTQGKQAQIAAGAQ